MKDEILAEMWQIKDQIAEEAHGRVQALFQRLKEVEDRSPHPKVDRTKLRERQAR